MKVEGRDPVLGSERLQARVALGTRLHADQQWRECDQIGSVLAHLEDCIAQDPTPSLTILALTPQRNATRGPGSGKRTIRLHLTPDLRYRH